MPTLTPLSQLVQSSKQLLQSTNPAEVTDDRRKLTHDTTAVLQHLLERNLRLASTSTAN